ncbi:MAG: SDR family oxidoreductase [Chloroflexi bacterium]|nr:SDR family oxidoreductase [Chloroflexota bacterium]
MIGLVTGGNRGIGLEIVRQLAQEGHTIILTSRDMQQGDEVAQEMRKAGLDVIAHKLEVTSQDDIGNLQTFVEVKFGRLDMLVNNAGIYPDEGRRFLDIELDLVRYTLEVNTLAPSALTKAFVPMMIAQNFGRIVNVSSGMGQLTYMGGGTGAYKLSKAALNAVTRITAGEVRRYNIKINAMCPGWVRTDMGGRGAPRSVEQGADTAVWLATLPDDGPSGGFFRDRKPLEW